MFVTLARLLVSAVLSLFVPVFLSCLGLACSIASLRSLPIDISNPLAEGIEQAMSRVLACVRVYVGASMIVLLSLPGLSTTAAGEDIKTIATNSGAGNFSALLKGAESMRAGFKHSMRDVNGTLLDESSGWMAWQRPDNFRWEVLEPLAQTLLINGEIFYQYDRDLEQLIIAPVSPEVSALPDVLLTGDEQAISEKYHVEAIHAVPAPASAGPAKNISNAPHLFRLTPRQSGGLFTAILVEFDRSQIAAIDIEDDLQQTSRFEFSAASPLGADAAELFTIDPAPGTEIIHQ